MLKNSYLAVFIIATTISSCTILINRYSKAYDIVIARELHFYKYLKTNTNTTKEVWLDEDGTHKEILRNGKNKIEYPDGSIKIIQVSMSSNNITKLETYDTLKDERLILHKEFSMSKNEYTITATDFANEQQALYVESFTPGKMRSKYYNKLKDNAGNEVEEWGEHSY